MQFQYLTSKVLKLLNELKNEKRQQELNSIEKINLLKQQFLEHKKMWEAVCSS